MDTQKNFCRFSCTIKNNLQTLHRYLKQKEMKTFMTANFWWWHLQNILCE